MATDSMAVSKSVEAISFWQGAVAVLGRLFFAAIFLTAGPSHFTKHAIGYVGLATVDLTSAGPIGIL